MARRRALLVLPLAALAAAGCGSSSGGSRVLTLHVTGRPARRSSSACTFVIENPLREGGRQRTCLTRVQGFPSPGTTMHSRGRMAFVLQGGTIRARVQIVQRFAADGVHATQHVEGTVGGGTGRYRGETGTIRGGGTVADRAGGLGPVRLQYQLTLHG